MSLPTTLTAEELLVALGERVRQRRLDDGWKQETLASKSGASVKAIRALESGSGSTLLTLARVLKALGMSENLLSTVPAPMVSPMALLRTPDGPKRGNR